MRIYMQTSALEEQSPRFYQICLEPDLLEGWMVVKEWGHAGASGRVKHEYYTSLEDAQQEVQSTRDAQIKRGYKVVFVQGDATGR